MLGRAASVCATPPRFSSPIFFRNSRSIKNCNNYSNISDAISSFSTLSRSSMESSNHRSNSSPLVARASSSAQPLQNADELIDSVETFIFDCDGVIWKGDKLIEGVPDTLDMLRSRGKRLVFVTNNSTKSRKQYGKKFETLGLSVSEEEIFASSFAAAAYLKSIDFPKDKKIYVIGEEGILKELELAGFSYLGGPAHLGSEDPTARRHKVDKVGYQRLICRPIYLADTHPI